MSKETFDTLGNQKATNYALRTMSKEQFIQEVTDGLQPPPAYFPENVLMNIQGYESIDTVLKRGANPLTSAAFEAAANETGALILDTRSPQDFAREFIPGSINIGIDGSFAPWVGALISDIRQEILLVNDPGREEEVLTRLARVGYENILGFLDGGITTWKAAAKETDRIPSISADEFAALQYPEMNILDVRKASEYQAEHLENAENVPLDYINDHFSELDKDKTYFIHCAGGYRSMIFASILKARGFEHLTDIRGGFKAIRDSGAFPLTDFSCPSTLKQ